MNTKTVQAISVIDQAINIIALPLAGMSDREIPVLFSRVFAHKDDELIRHYISQFIHNSDKDFGQWFFSCEHQIIRELFEYYKMDMESDKYTDDTELIMAQFLGKSKEDLYPFEYYVLYQFYRMAGNNSLQLLKKIIPEAYDRIQSRGMDLFGNGLNWSKAWNVLNNAEREILVDYLINVYKG